jgi:hypothetical protein
MTAQIVLSDSPGRPAFVAKLGRACLKSFSGAEKQKAADFSTNQSLYPANARKG